jgi:divinyl chlorophyllide a 8-vinyl-reductase
MFGDGEICKCNPISEADLAEYIVKSIDDQSMHHQVLDVGGPDEGLTPKRQAEILFEVVGKEPRFIAVPIGLFDAIIGTIDFFAQFFDGAKDAAELARIGKYYAVEDMLATGGGEQYGQITLREHFARIAKEGNEYDPYTTMFSSKKEA